jgi:hypothetical protein
MTIGIVRVAALAAWDTGRARGDDYVDLQGDQFGHEIGETIHLSLPVAVFDDEVSALHVAQVCHPLTEGLGVGQVGGPREGSTRPIR